MHDQHLFEYAVIRVVPRVEREEFLNVGVVLFCKKQGYLKTVFSLNEQRLGSLFAELDIDELRANLQAFERISNGDKEAGPIARLDAPSRFRWLTATRSTVLQTSKVHPGFCGDPEENLEKIFKEMVL